MNTKLTLNIDDHVIELAKLYAKRQKRSVSKLVEDYLYSVSNKSAQTKTSAAQLGPITSELLGALKTKETADYRELLEESLMEKYL